MEWPTAPRTHVWLAASGKKPKGAPTQELPMQAVMPAAFVEMVHSSRGVAYSHATLGWCLYLHGWSQSVVPVGEPGVSAQRRKHEERWYSWAFLAVGHRLHSLKLSRRWCMCTAASPLGEIRCPRASCWACTDHRWERVKTLESSRRCFSSHRVCVTDSFCLPVCVSCCPTGWEPCFYCFHTYSQNYFYCWFLTHLDFLVYPLYCPERPIKMAVSGLGK